MISGRAWTKTHEAMLSEMWLCGVSSSLIAPVLERSRHAVMGKVDKLGLMKRQRSGMMTPCSLSISKTAVERSADEYLLPTDSSKYRAISTIILAMIADGRNSERLPQIAGSTDKMVSRVSQVLNLSSIWPSTGGPPIQWWIEGVERMREDMLKITVMTIKHR